MSAVSMSSTPLLHQAVAALGDRATPANVALSGVAALAALAAASDIYHRRLPDSAKEVIRQAAPYVRDAALLGSSALLTHESVWTGQQGRWVLASASSLGALVSGLGGVEVVGR